MRSPLHISLRPAVASELPAIRLQALLFWILLNLILELILEKKEPCPINHLTGRGSTHRLPSRPTIKSHPPSMLLPIRSGGRDLAWVPNPVPQQEHLLCRGTTHRSLLRVLRSLVGLPERSCPSLLLSKDIDSLTEQKVNILHLRAPVSLLATRRLLWCRWQKTLCCKM